MSDLIRSLRQYGHVEAADAIETLLADKARLQAALRETLDLLETRSGIDRYEMQHIRNARASLNRSQNND